MVRASRPVRDRAKYDVSPRVTHPTTSDSGLRKPREHRPPGYLLARADHVIHMSEEEAARDFAALMARGRAGAEVVIESDTRPAAILRAAATALHLGFDVATFNVRHVQMIPGLQTVSL